MNTNTYINIGSYVSAGTYELNIEIHSTTYYNNRCIFDYISTSQTNGSVSLHLAPREIPQRYLITNTF